MLRYGFVLFFLCVPFLPVAAQSQISEEEKAQFEERLRALEKHFGIESGETSPEDYSSLLKRLEALETKVFQHSPTAPSSATHVIVAPQPEETSDMTFQAWDGDEEKMKEFEDEMASDSSGGFLSSYGSQFGGLEIRGYGILSYLYDDKRDSNTFRADGVELDLTKQFADFALVGVDLDFINEGLDPVFPPFRSLAYNTGGSGGIYGGSGTGGDDDDDFILEQLFVKTRVTDNLEVTGGKFNVPVGLEKRDPHERYNIAPSLLFPLWPRDLSGVMATYQVSDDFSINPYIFNGWDLDENNNDSFIYALYNNYQVTDWLNVASTVAYGAPHPGNNSDQAFLFDAEIRYTGIPDFWLGLEYMYVNSDVDNIRRLRRLGDVTYQGFLGIAHYDFNTMFGLTLQSSLVLDEDGFVYGSSQDRWEVSIIPSVHITEFFEMRLQYQHLESDTNISFTQPNSNTSIWSKSDDILLLSAIVLF